MIINNQNKNINKIMEISFFAACIGITTDCSIENAFKQNGFLRRQFLYSPVEEASSCGIIGEIRKGGTAKC